jgi:hypothetical protein
MENGIISAEGFGDKPVEIWKMAFYRNLMTIKRKSRED